MPAGPSHIWSSQRDLDLEAVSQVYRHEPITEVRVKQLNPEIDLQSLDAELLEIGYPSK
jgi:hypothetical protein